MRVAIYARVSTERQERQQTIDSQLGALRGWVAGNGHTLDEGHIFRDEGYSVPGSTGQASTRCATSSATVPSNSPPS